MWRALAAALPRVAQQATWYGHDRRVEWVVDATGLSWSQVLTASVTDAPSSGSVVTLSGTSPVRPSFGDRRRRKRLFGTLTAAIDDALAHPMTSTVEPIENDEFRWWNGRAWTVDAPA